MTITDPVTEVEQKVSTADALRALADVLDEHPELVPSFVRPGYTAWVNPFRLADPDEFPALVRALGGKRNKKVDEATNSIDVSRVFGPGVKLTVYLPRDENCERVQVGEQTVEREEIVTPAVTRKVTVVEPVYEWDCSPVLAITDEAKAAAAEGLPAARQSLADGLAHAEPF